MLFAAIYKATLKITGLNLMKNSFRFASSGLVSSIGFHWKCNESLRRRYFIVAVGDDSYKDGDDFHKYGPRDG